MADFDVSVVVRRLPGQLTGVTVILPSGGRRYILTYAGTRATMSYADLDLSYALNARHLHLSSYFLHRALRPHIARLFHEAKTAGLTTSLDTNDDPENLWTDDLRELLNFVDVLLPNEREACRIARTEHVEQAAKILSDRVSMWSSSSVKKEPWPGTAKKLFGPCRGWWSWSIRLFRRRVCASIHSRKRYRAVPAVCKRHRRAVHNSRRRDRSIS
jgi:pfkB family carbohydrate kinase